MKTNNNDNGDNGNNGGGGVAHHPVPMILKYGSTTASARATPEPQDVVQTTEPQINKQSTGNYSFNKNKDIINSNGSIIELETTSKPIMRMERTVGSASASSGSESQSQSQSVGMKEQLLYELEDAKDMVEEEINVGYATLARPLRGRFNRNCCFIFPWSHVLFTWSRTSTIRLGLRLFVLLSCCLAFVLWIELFMSSMLEVCMCCMLLSCCCCVAVA